jgi:uncharacterized repeat protein (TIGR02543 family)
LGNGNGVQKDGSSIVTTASNHDLYAIWIPNNAITVTFNSNGGTNLSLSTKSVVPTLTYGNLATAEKTGYMLAGWYLDNNTFNNSITSSSTVVETSNHNLYAKWTIESFNIAFNLNYVGAPTPPTSISANFNASISAPANPIRTGYTFDGWYEEVGTTTSFTIPSTMPDLGSSGTTKTLYAKWTIESYTIAFDLNYVGAPTPPTSITANFNASISAPANPARTGYTFGGWYEEAGVTNAYSIPSNMPDLGSSGTTKTLYAKFTANNNSIIFNGNNSTSGTMANQSIATDAVANLNANQFGRTGFIFTGWNTEANGTGTAYSNQASYTMGTNASYTLFAQWSQSYTITLNKNSGTDGTSTLTVANNQPMPSDATAPSRSGFFFGGYYTATNGGGTQYFDSDMTPKLNYPLTTNTTLYAKWTAYITLAKPTLSSANSSSVFNFTDSSDSYSLPVYSGNEIVLTNDVSQQSAFFTNEKITLGNGFSTYFEIKQYRTSRAVPADQIVFVLSGNSKTVGQGFGYTGITNSIGVVFDNYFNNGDPALDSAVGDVFTTVYKDGNSGIWNTNQSIRYDTNFISNYGEATLNALVRTYKVWLNYDKISRNLNFKIDVNGTISTRDFTGVDVPSEFYAGFTAGTGGESVGFAVPTWYFANSYYAAGINPASTTETFVEESADTGIVTQSNLNLELDPHRYSGSGNLLDTSVNTNNATISSATFDNIGKYFIFNGSSSFMNVADNASIEPANSSFSLEAWFYPTTNVGSQAIAVKTDGGNSAEFGYGLRYNDGILRFEVGNGAAAVNISTIAPITLNTWHHVVGSYDMSGNYTLYLNGVNIATFARPYASIRNTTSVLSIGRFSQEFGQYFNGRIGEVRYYGKALSQQQVTNNYNARKGRYGIS